LTTLLQERQEANWAFTIHGNQIAETYARNQGKEKLEISGRAID